MGDWVVQSFCSVLILTSQVHSINMPTFKHGGCLQQPYLSQVRVSIGKITDRKIEDMTGKSLAFWKKLAGPIEVPNVTECQGSVCATFYSIPKWSFHLEWKSERVDSRKLAVWGETLQIIHGLTY